MPTYVPFCFDFWDSMLPGAPNYWDYRYAPPFQALVVNSSKVWEIEARQVVGYRSCDASSWVTVE